MTVDVRDEATSDDAPDVLTLLKEILAELVAIQYVLKHPDPADRFRRRRFPEQYQ